MNSENSSSPESENGSYSGREKDTKICKVCGDKALGYNFNAITCESCKAFFRRNALKDKEFKCPFNKKCEINPVTRRFCQLCRLIKCFEIGMKKEYIMSEDDKREKRKKIEQNRAIKKRTVDDVADSSNESTPKMMKMDKNQDEEDDNWKTKKSSSIKINLLNMASSSGKTYQKKQTKYSTGEDPLAPFPSPGVPEPASPGGATITESRTCNVFEQNNPRFDSNRSRPVEIYQLSKVHDFKSRISEDYGRETADSTIIKTILNAEVSKPQSIPNGSPAVEAYEDEDEERLSNHYYKQDFHEDEEYLLSQSEVLELTRNKNLILEATKDGNRIILIPKESVLNGERPTEIDSKEIMRYNPHVRTDYHSNDESDKRYGRRDSNNQDSTPLLSSLINTSGSSESDSHAPLSFRSDVAEEVLQDIPRNSSIGTSKSIESILSEAIKLEYEAYTSMNPRMNSRELNDAERAKLNELIVANKALLLPLDDDISGLMGEDCRFSTTSTCDRPMLVDVLNLTAVAIRRLIKMSKKINAFKNMCQEDQIALLKGGCTEMMILRSAMTYDSDRDSWKIPHSKEKLMNIKVDVLKEAGGKVFEEHQRFLQTFDKRWRNDENIMLILSAITLFTPDRPRVVHYDVIKLEQNSYYYLLRRYLESQYQGCEARSTFLKLIHKISELHKLNEDHVRVYLDVNPKDIEPLLIEIFDLKPH